MARASVLWRFVNFGRTNGTAGHRCPAVIAQRREQEADGSTCEIDGWSDDMDERS